MQASSKKSNKLEKFRNIAWIIPFLLIWLILTEAINLILNDFLPVHDHGVWGLFDEAFKIFTKPSWYSLFMLTILICTGSFVAWLGFIFEQEFKLNIYKRLLPNAIREFNILKRVINKTIIGLVNKGDDDFIKKRDEIYAELLRHMQSEFNLDGVSIESIEKCIDELSNILFAHGEIEEVYALTDFSGDSWLTRTMLLYLIRTIQISDKVPNDNNKLRVFLRKTESSNSDSESFKRILSLHNGFLPTIQKDLDYFNEKFKNIENPAFLYIKLKKETKPRFWTISKYETIKIWETKNVIPSEYNTVINWYKSELIK